MIEKRLGQLALQITKCEDCSLCRDRRHGRKVLWRGNPESGRMIIGLAPGQEEEIQGTPLVGPSGQMLEAGLKALGFGLERDFFVTNVIHCRSFPPEGDVSRQNAPVPDEALEACLDHWGYQVYLLQPKLIVSLGRQATTTITKDPKAKFGKAITVENLGTHSTKCTVFPMYHPAYLLKNKKDPEKYEEIKKIMWEHYLKLKQTIKEIDNG